MKKYRLKPEAVPFFSESIATQILDLEIWKKNHVEPKALEEVEDAYLSYGQKSGENSKNLGGWDKDGSEFLFTVHFPSVKFREHDEFSKGKVIRGLMDRIQSCINNFYSDFVNDKQS
ncbi:hypothetical protein [Parapedobacter indicus]|uniref:Uncharacterized protein n=1 Tax=Parapedobacter indicus TaxID=1477437 RepID=A0A1I3UZX9_9SPHI|nr:hypothetical protein [Parapedobacter indicus]PPK99027.1 hypothetical protein CLV26_11557 [Parapedobacter indicus]SFJ88259.1 hypothetical protein SAMN05444682_115120 [Parapedobacter indicus]